MQYKKRRMKMDTWTVNKLEQMGIDPSTACKECGYANGINNGYRQGPCGQANCGLTLYDDDEEAQ